VADVPRAEVALPLTASSEFDGSALRDDRAYARSVQKGSPGPRPRQTLVEPAQSGRAGHDRAAVIALDRWGRVLVAQVHEGADWSLPAGPVEAGESADAAALRTFEEEAGHLLEELRLFGIFSNAPRSGDPPSGELHVYYCDPDLDAEMTGVVGGPSFRYLAKADMHTVALAPPTRKIVDQFFLSTHYRAMFH
jgi:8-oxo-dGTP pyrophosphatase MutT (NUDIX family)